MQRSQLARDAAKRVAMIGLMCAGVTQTALASGRAMAEGHSSRTSSGGAGQVVRQYFADLAARKFTAAHFLEAPCSHTVQVHPGYAEFQARAPWHTGDARAEGRYIHTVRVTNIAPFHLPLLTAGHMQGFRLFGYFAFARPTSPAGNPHEPTTLTRLVVFTWQCGGHWWVDPYWIYSSRQYGSH